MPEEEEDNQPASHSLPPSALELAKLAALLMRADRERRAEAGGGQSTSMRNLRLADGDRFATRDALLRAVRFYLEAAILYEELSGMSEESLFALLLGSDRKFDHIHHLFGDTWFSSSAQSYALYKDGIQSIEPNYKRDFKDGLDPARRYLQQHGSIHNWVKCNTVVNSISKYFEDYARRYNLRHAATIAGFEQGISRIAAEMGVPEDEVFEWRFRNDHRRALDGNNLYESFLRVVSIKDHSASPSNTLRESRPVIGWALPIGFLKALIKWRNAQKKRPGGITGSPK